jgi:hypothetical protein
MGYEIRKWVSQVEEINHDGGTPGRPLVKAAVGVIFRNPFSGSYVEDLSALIEPSGKLGMELGLRAVALLGGLPVASYGKGGIVGVAGEQEHVVACVTSVFGNGLREAVGGGDAWIASFTKVASAGEPLDIPLAHKDALYVRSHYDGLTLSVPDAPRPDEIMVCIAVASGPRVHERSGGINPAEIQGGGLR